MKNLNKIKDIDFDALLLAAKAEHKKCSDACKAHELDQDPTEFRKAQAEWERWCRVNLTDRGIDMVMNATSGEPLRLFIVVAGKSSENLPCKCLEKRYNTGTTNERN